MQGILLAAGDGRRFQAAQATHHPQKDKLLALMFERETSVLMASANALLQVLPTSLAIVQPQQTERKEQLLKLGMQVVESPDAKFGMGNTIAGAVAASVSASAWLICLADMPWITPRLIEAVTKGLKTDRQIALPTYQGRLGHPVAFGAHYRDALLALQGDKGAKELIQLHPQQVINLPWDNASIFRDVDTPTDLIDNLK